MVNHQSNKNRSILFPFFLRLPRSSQKPHPRRFSRCAAASCSSRRRPRKKHRTARLRNRLGRRHRHLRRPREEPPCRLPWEAAACHLGAPDAEVCRRFLAGNRRRRKLLPELRRTPPSTTPPRSACNDTSPAARDLAAQTTFASAKIGYESRPLLDDLFRSHCCYPVVLCCFYLGKIESDS